MNIYYRYSILWLVIIGDVCAGQEVYSIQSGCDNKLQQLLEENQTLIIYPHTQETMTQTIVTFVRELSKANYDLNVTLARSNQCAQLSSMPLVSNFKQVFCTASLLHEYANCWRAHVYFIPPSAGISIKKYPLIQAYAHWLFQTTSCYLSKQQMVHLGFYIGAVTAVKEASETYCLSFH